MDYVTHNEIIQLIETFLPLFAFFLFASCVVFLKITYDLIFLIIYTFNFIRTRSRRIKSQSITDEVIDNVKS